MNKYLFYQVVCPLNGINNNIGYSHHEENPTANIENNEVSFFTQEITTIGFSWERENFVHDNDQDLKNDTIELSYEFYDFNVTGSVVLDINIKILFWNNIVEEWEYIDSIWDTFEENIIADHNYSWSFMWTAWYEGDYVFQMFIYDDQTRVLYEWIEWDNVYAFTLFHNWEYKTNEYDNDTDGNNDTLEIVYSFNSSYTGSLELDIISEIYYWEEDSQTWSFLVDHLDGFQKDVTNNEIYEWHFIWSAWYDGDYNFSTTILGEHNRLLITENVLWNDAYSYSFFNNWSYLTIESDADLDGFNDTIEIEYSFDSRKSGEVNFSIITEIYYWDNDYGGWYYLTYYIDPFEKNIVAGVPYKWSFNWYALYDGDYNFTITIIDESTSRPLIEEIISWNDARSYLFISEWSHYITEFDNDTDGNLDTIGFTYIFNSSYTGLLELSIQVDIFHWDEEVDGWYFIDEYQETYEKNVTFGGTYEWGYNWSALYDGNYNFTINIYDEHERLIIDGFIQWDNAHSFSYLNGWSYRTNKFDNNGDNCKDTITIKYTFNYSYTGLVLLSITLDVYYWNEESWLYIDETQEDFEKDVVYGTTREWNYEWSALYDGDYNFTITIYDKHDRELLYETFLWAEACAVEVTDTITPTYSTSPNNGHSSTQPETDGIINNDDYTSLLILTGIGVISLITGTAFILNRKFYHTRVSKKSLTDIQKEITQKDKYYLKDIRAKIDEIENTQIDSSKTSSDTEKKDVSFKRRRR